MNSYLHFFGEYARFRDAEEEKEAKLYLELWKKNLVRKLSNQCYKIEVLEEQYISRDPILSGILAQETQIALKLAVKVVFNFEVSPIGQDGILKQ